MKTTLQSRGEIEDASLWPSGLRTQHRICEKEGWIRGLPQWLKDPGLPWLWCRPAAAASVQPLACERPYAAGTAIKK